MRRTREQKGITLVALIITIVVLLILAVVAINSITNDEIINKTEESTNKYNESVQNEADQLQNYIDVLNQYANGAGAGEGDEPKTYAAYTVGQEVKLVDQTKETGTFYVLANSDTTQEKVTLVTRLPIDPEDLLQSATADTVAFGSFESYLNLGSASPSPTVNPAAYAAFAYGEKIGGSGRLMSESEAKTLYSLRIPGALTSHTSCLFYDDIDGRYLGSWPVYKF